MRYPALLASALLLALTGCSTLAPGAEQVKITRNPNDVVGCQIIGPVGLNAGPYGAFAIGTSQENETLSRGGDTLLITSTWLIKPSYHGIVYRCHGEIVPRQPVPVEVTK